jgi:vacuole morphology and inheritance protein 14
VLLVGSRSEVLAHQGDLAPALLDSLADASDQVVLQALDVQASLSREDPHFRMFMVRKLVSRAFSMCASCKLPLPLTVVVPQERLLRHFCGTPMLLESRGSLIVRRLCVLLGAERVFRELAAFLMEESNLQFAGLSRPLSQHFLCRV